MAENNQGGQGGGEGQGHNQGGGEGGGTPAQRPEYIPEKFWNGEKGAPKLEEFGRSYSDLATRQAKGKEALVPVIKQELETERLKNRPAKPEDYKIEAPKAGLADGLVVLSEKPAADFKPEADKKYFLLDQKSPLFQFWREHAHATGLGQEDFDKGVVAFLNTQAANAKTENQRKAERVAEYKKLGENGPARVDHVWKGLNAAVGEQHAKALDAVVGSAGAVEALEALLEKAGGTKFSPAGGGGEGGGQPTMAQVRKLQNDSDYWENTDKQAQVRAMLEKIGKGKNRTA